MSAPRGRRLRTETPSCERDSIVSFRAAASPHASSSLFSSEVSALTVALTDPSRATRRPDAAVLRRASGTD